MKLKRLFASALMAASLLSDPASAQTHKPVQGDPTPTPVSALQRTRDKWGYNNDADISKEARSYPPEVYKMMSDAGFGWQRYNLYWNNVNPAPGVYDWSAPDAAIKAAAKNNQQTYVTVFWGPAWATSDEKWFEPFYCYCWDGQPAPYNDRSKYFPPTGYPWGFLNDRPECAKPKTMDVAAWRDFVRQAVQRYDGKDGMPEVKHWGFTNEPNNLFFWPPRFQHWKEGKAEADTVIELVDWVLKPAYDVAHDVARERGREVFVVGPDENKETTLEGIMSHEKRVGRIADIISYHTYGGNEDMYNDVVGLNDVLFKPVLDRVADGRDVWWTESGAYSTITLPGNPMTAQELQADHLVGLFKIAYDRPWIKRFFLYRAHDDGNEGLGIINGDLTPRASYTAISKYLRTLR